MSTARSHRIELNCFVLHTRPYRETSALVTVLSQHWGKVNFVAKGIRAKKHAKTALLQLFLPLNVQVFGQHELKNLAQIEAQGIALVLKNDFLYAAMYINELLMRVLPVEMPCSAIFTLYQQALNQLSKQMPLEPLLRDFELNLLDDLGYGVDFTIDMALSEPICPDDHYRYHPELGFVSDHTARTQEQRRSVLTGQVIIDIAERNWHAYSLRAAKQINRVAMRTLLGNKPLKSRELFVKR